MQKTDIDKDTDTLGVALTLHGYKHARTYSAWLQNRREIIFHSAGRWNLILSPTILPVKNRNGETLATQTSLFKCISMSFYSQFYFTYIPHYYLYKLNNTGNNSTFMFRFINLSSAVLHRLRPTKKQCSAAPKMRGFHFKELYLHAITISMLQKYIYKCSLYIS